MADITRQISDYNHSSRYGESIIGIVIHYTSNYTDTAAANAHYFCEADRGASAHYFVDETSIYQSVEESEAAWSVGRKFGDARLWGIYTNQNTISVEMCSSGGKIAERTMHNTADLVRMLLAKYGLSLDDVARHWDVCAKRCPGWDGWLPGDESQWNRLKDMIAGGSGAMEQTHTETAPATPDTWIQVYTSEHGWHPAVKNLDDYAGWGGWHIKAIAVNASSGQLTYRVHVKGGGWYPTVTGFDVNDFDNGFAGDKVHDIDGIQIYYDTDLEQTDGHYYQARYQVQTEQGGHFLPTVIDTDWADGDGKSTAGTFGQAITKVYFHLG